MGRAVLAIVILLSALGTERMGGVQAESVRNLQQMTVRVTYYEWTGYRMASGLWPYEGAAACSFDLPLGQWVELDGVSLHCLDRGHLRPTHIDVFCASDECRTWVRGIGPYATATVEGE